MRDAVAVDVALNPDFSQVESDQPQVAVNQRFELFYPEKRPFFLESASVFKYVRTAPTDPTTRNVPEMLFFSRRIQNPQLGARVTGKSRAVVVRRDCRRRSRVRRGGDGGPRAAIAVGRVQREFGKQSTVGVFVTSRERGATIAIASAALDVRLEAVAQLGVRRPGGREPTASAPAARHSPGPRTTRRCSTAAGACSTARSTAIAAPTFRAALGFVPRTDIRQIEQYGEYRWRPRAGPGRGVRPEHVRPSELEPRRGSCRNGSSGIRSKCTSRAGRRCSCAASRATSSSTASACAATSRRSTSRPSGSSGCRSPKASSGA